MSEKYRKVLPAIIVVAYNRPEALKRLLYSIKKADYTGYDKISLIISIDGGGNKDVKNVANSYEWNYGSKEVVIHEKNYGLRNHVLKCGQLSLDYGNIIMIEEDCFVSVDFYQYAVKAIDFYANDINIAGISLYNYSINENAQLPFFPLKNGYDVYFMQVPSSLGQIWTKQQWSGFIEFYNKNPEIKEIDLLPENVKKWPETSWKKYFYKYIVDKDKYFVFPHLSLTTNFGDAGTHFKEPIALFQVPLSCNKIREYKFQFLEKSTNIYDAYFEILPHCIGIKEKNVGMDLFGTKQLSLFDFEYAYSIKDCKVPLISYGSDLKPNFLNIIYQIDGNVIHYALKKNFTTLRKEMKSKFLKDQNLYSFNSGFEEGFKAGKEDGETFIRKSRPYRIGNFFLRPLKFLRK